MMNTFQFALVVVRAIGLCLVIVSCVMVVSWTVQLVVLLPVPPISMTAYSYGYSESLLYGVFGIALIHRSARVARLLARGTYAEGHCQRCGYNLSGSDATRCPECGDSGPTSHKGPGETR